MMIKMVTSILKIRKKGRGVLKTLEKIEKRPQTRQGRLKKL